MSRIEYLKKKDKKASIKAVKSEAVRGDATYKSSTISVATGQPATSGKLVLADAFGLQADEIVSSPQPPRMPKRKKAAKAAPAGMAVSLPLGLPK
jgi:myosin-1